MLVLVKHGVYFPVPPRPKPRARVLKRPRPQSSAESPGFTRAQTHTLVRAHVTHALTHIQQATCRCASPTHTDTCTRFASARHIPSAKPTPASALTDWDRCSLPSHLCRVQLPITEPRIELPPICFIKPGPIVTVRFSLDTKFLAVQRNRTDIEVLKGVGVIGTQWE